MIAKIFKEIIIFTTHRFPTGKLKGSQHQNGITEDLKDLKIFYKSDEDSVENMMQYLKQSFEKKSETYEKDFFYGGNGQKN